MVFNGVTEYLLQWCVEKRDEYFRRNQQERADTGRSLLFVKRSFYDEMVYKLCSLVDMDMEDFEAYRNKVRALIPVRKAYVLRNERDSEALALIREAEEEFRVILGEERERLEYDILEKWGYCADYWYPLKGGLDECKLFLNMEYLEPYWDRLCGLVGLPAQRVYAYGESFFDDGELAETDAIEGYGGNETAYLPRDLSWIIYFSHEDTVTFAGSILGAVKELLAAEREHWNKWE